MERLPNSWWESIQQKTIRGTPDILGCLSGYFVGVEIKFGDGELTALQRFKLEQINKVGGYGFQCCPETEEAVFAKLEKLSKGIRC